MKKCVQNFNISVFSSLSEIKNTWIEFQKHACCYGFQTYEWLYNWQNTIGIYEGYSPQLIQVKNSNDDILMLLPLAIQKRYNIRILTWMGGDYRNGLFIKDINEWFDSHISFDELWKMILNNVRKHDLIYFYSQPEIIGNEVNPFVKYLNVYPYHAMSHYIELDNDWDVYYKQNIKKRIKQDTRRQIKRLSEMGELSFCIADKPEDFSNFTEKMIEQKSIRYEMTNVKNLFKIDSYKTFYKQFFTKKRNQLTPHVATLKLDDEIIAVHWGIIHKKRFYYLMPSNNWGKWSKYSPGRLLLLKLIKWCYENNIKIFDFTGGNEAYKYDWANGSMKLYNYIRPRNLYGWAIAKILRLHHNRKRKK
jgi:CelD/BcsL family acetyltransferase involved in cellulose biosynthesis